MLHWEALWAIIPLAIVDVAVLIPAIRLCLHGSVNEDDE